MQLDFYLKGDGEAAMAEFRRRLATLEPNATFTGYCVEPRFGPGRWRGTAWNGLAPDPIVTTIEPDQRTSLIDEHRTLLDRYERFTKGVLDGLQPSLEAAADVVDDLDDLEDLSGISTLMKIFFTGWALFLGWVVPTWLTWWLFR